MSVIKSKPVTRVVRKKKTLVVPEKLYSELMEMAHVEGLTVEAFVSDIVLTPLVDSSHSH